jgi:hypothetical protein
MPASANTTVVAKPPLAAAMARITGTLADPWLRAAMLTPSVSDTMTVTRIGPTDARALSDLLHKPAQAFEMSFSTDPYMGLVADRFGGRAVVFLATVTFTQQTTASATFGSASTAALR